MKANLYELIEIVGGGFNIGDEIFDWGNYFDCYIDKEDLDDYDKCMIYFAKHIDVIKYQKDWYTTCNISQFILDNQKAFDRFMEEENKKEYTRKYYEKTYNEKLDINNEDFYDIYLKTFGNLINGNYCDKDYKKLLNYLIAYEK